MTRQNVRRLLLIAGAALVLSALAFVMFHHHDDGGHTSECFVCRLVSYFSFLFIAAVGLLISVSSRRLQPVFVQKSTPVLLTSNLKGRSPPTQHS